MVMVQIICVVIISLATLRFSSASRDASNWLERNHPLFSSYPWGCLWDVATFSWNQCFQQSTFFLRCWRLMVVVLHPHPCLFACWKITVSSRLRTRWNPLHLQTPCTARLDRKWCKLGACLLLRPMLQHPHLGGLHNGYISHPRRADGNLQRYLIHKRHSRPSVIWELLLQILCSLSDRTSGWR